MTDKYCFPSVTSHWKEKENCNGLLLELLNNTEDFCRNRCNILLGKVAREKRYIEFESSNRALITHRFEVNPEPLQNSVKNNSIKQIVEIVKSKLFQNKESNLCYLFCPKERVGWLKVMLDDKELVVAQDKEIKEYIKGIITNLSHNNINDDDFNEVWGEKNGKPCFAVIKEIPDKPYIITVSYYDSLRLDNEEYEKASSGQNTNDNKKSSFTNKCLFRHLLDKAKPRLNSHCVRYDFHPSKDFNSWMYVKAPYNYEIEFDEDTFKINNNSFHIEPKSQDKIGMEREFPSITIIPTKPTNENNANKDDKNNLEITFSIKPPESLIVWYKTIYVLSLITLILTILYFIIYAVSTFHIYPNFIDKDKMYINLMKLYTPVITAIVATRGWIIKGEVIMKEFSNQLTRFLLLIIIINILTVFVMHLAEYCESLRLFFNI